MTLTLDIPASVDREKLLRAAVALYDAGIMTQGEAAEMSGLSRIEFFDELGRRGVTPFQYTWQEALAEGMALAGKEGPGEQ